MLCVFNFVCALRTTYAKCPVECYVCTILYLFVLLFFYCCQCGVTATVCSLNRKIVINMPTFQTLAGSVTVNHRACDRYLFRVLLLCPLCITFNQTVLCNDRDCAFTDLQIFCFFFLVCSFVQASGYLLSNKCTCICSFVCTRTVAKLLQKKKYCPLFALVSILFDLRAKMHTEKRHSAIWLLLLLLYVYFLQYFLIRVSLSFHPRDNTRSRIPNSR